MNFKPINFKNDKISYIAPSWEQMGTLTFNLALQILKSQKKFDRLITLAKGGWTWSRTLADYLKIENMASIQIQFYTDIGKTKDKSTIIQSLPLCINKEKILLFDDISDTGNSLITAQKYLNLCGANKIHPATLFYKPWTRLKPDFFSAQTQAWVIFPHEIRETVELVGKRWQKQKISKNQIVKRFTTIGLPGNQVKYFLKTL
jgi:uncharacterized protein